MAHRRVKDISYDDDGLDDYDDYDETYEAELAPSTEDEEQLRKGTADVRVGLGEDSDLPTDKEIREALWYYYFDVAKSVEYLRKQRRPEQKATPKKQKSPSKFDEAAQAAVGSGGAPDTLDSGIPLWHSTRPRSAVDFFADTPFLAVPPHRLGVITVIPRFPKGGLLGGSGNGAAGNGKPSKLAALAASRKKLAEEKRKAESASSVDDKSNASLRMLDRIGKRQKMEVDPAEEVRKDVESMSVSGQRTLSRGELRSDRIPAASMEPTVTTDKKRAYPQRRTGGGQETPPVPTLGNTEESSDLKEETHDLQLDNLNATPSTFATCLFSQATQNSQRNPAANLKGGRDIFALPYSIPREQRTNYHPFSGPSPDDIVANAQRGKGSKDTKRIGAKKGTESDTVAGVANLKLDDGTPIPSGATTPQRIKSKNLDIAAEYAKSNAKRSANFVVIGHVDHGKSTLMGRLLYDTGTHITPRAFARLASSAAAAGKSSFSYAWLMDSTAEERSRGITVDIAQTSFSTPDCDFTILDAPGHKDFVPNMIAGASQADFAVLVVDASRGEFEKGLEGGGQTKEHALLIRGLGVGRVVVAINKMDNIGWSEDRFREVEGQMSAFLMKVGYKRDDVRCVPCAGLTGENVVYRVPPQSEEGNGKSKTGKSTTTPKSETSASSTPDRFSWYPGPTLLSSLSDLAPSIDRHAALLDQPFRLSISDIFRGGITNPLSVSGRIDVGAVQVGDSLIAMPANEICFVKGIDVESSSSKSTADEEIQKPAEYAIAGQITTLHLAEIDAMHLRLGDVLCSASNPVRNARAFTAKVLAFEHIVPGALDCHRGRLHCAASVKKLLSLLSSGAKVSDEEAARKRVRIVKPGQAARILIELERVLPMEIGTRIVLRSEGTTVAAGLVEEVELAR